MSNDTRRRIMDTALELFNAQGLHAVGVRDIARALGISPGNLAYHFPQKEVLIVALVHALHATNNTRILAQPPGPFGFEAFYRAMLGVMVNQIRYRFYLYSYVDVLRVSPELQAEDMALNHGRRERIRVSVDRLIEIGLLDPDMVMPRFDRLYEQLRILMTNWLRAAAFEPVADTDEGTMLHYAKLAVSLFEPYCTPAGQAEMGALLAGEYDAAAIAAWRSLDAVPAG